MKKTFLIAALLFTATVMLSQTPQKFNYQAIPRDLSGNAIVNTQIALQMSILEGGPTGTLVYAERHFLNTGPLGIVNLQIGGGQVVSGAFSAVEWATGNKWLKVEMDPTGGFNFQLLSTLEFQSVPYALFAESVGKVTDISLSELTDVNTTGVATGQVLKWNGVTWAPAADNGQFYLAGTGIDISGNIISNTGDTDPADDLTLSSTAGGDVSGQFSNLQITPNAVSTNELADGAVSGQKIAQMSAVSGQVLKWDGATWLPQNDISSGAGDNWGSQVVQTTPVLSGMGTAASPLSLAQQGAANGQVLKWAGSGWIPAADNWGFQFVQTDATLSGTGELSTPLKLAQQGAATGQVLKWNGSTWIPQNDVGGGVGDNWGSQVVVADITLSGAGTAGSPLTIATQGATNGQVLKYNGSAWIPGQDDGQTYTAGTGITLAGTTINSTWTNTGANINNNNIGHVGIGTANPDGTLSVLGDGEDGVIYAEYTGDNDDAKDKFGIVVRCDVGGLGETIGGKFIGKEVGIIAYGNFTGVGGLGHGYGILGGTGVYGEADDGSGTNRGVHGVAYGSTSVNFGLYGDAEVGSSPGSSAGVYGTCTGSGNGVIGEANGQNAYAIWGKSTDGFAGKFAGNVSIVGNLSKSSGTFKIDHPMDPANKYLYHSFVESPDMMNIYNGNATTDAEGFATVKLPAYFEALNMEFRYQLTVIGVFAQAIVANKIENNSFVIQTDKPNIEVSWQVTGVRQDPYATAHRVVPEVEKEPENKGKYLHPEVYGFAENAGIDYERAAKLRQTRENAALELARKRFARDQGSSNPDPESPNPKN